MHARSHTLPYTYTCAHTAILPGTLFHLYFVKAKSQGSGEPADDKASAALWWPFQSLSAQCPPAATPRACVDLEPPMVCSVRTGNAFSALIPTQGV